MSRAATPSWGRRRARAMTLAARHETAADLLAFYARVVELQAGVAAEAEGWLRARPGVLAPRSTGPLVDRTLVRDTAPLGAYLRFVREAARDATPVLAAVGRELLDDPGAAEVGLEASGRGEPEEPAAAFFPRAFLQPVIEVAVAQVRGTGHRPDASRGTGTPAACPWCGGPPQVGQLLDDDEVRGRRLLECGWCQQEWGYPRAACPRCGETEADARSSHIADTWPHVRLDACRTCGGYLKAVDLRLDGLAVPVVDEIASVELDLWADEQGLEKLQPNLLGL